MADGNLTRKRSLFVLLAALLLLASGVATAGAEDAQEVLKGTVVDLADGVLTLKGVRFQDATIPAQTVKIRTEKGTAYFDGPIQITKEAIVPDLLVLVRCTLNGPERKAVVVRIIGGKKS